MVWPELIPRSSVEALLCPRYYFCEFGGLGYRKVGPGIVPERALHSNHPPERFPHSAPPPCSLPLAGPWLPHPQN